MLTEPRHPFVTNPICHKNCCKRVVTKHSFVDSITSSAAAMLASHPLLAPPCAHKPSLPLLAAHALQAARRRRHQARTAVAAGSTAAEGSSGGGSRPSTSVSRSALSTCRRCKQPFSAEDNHDGACHYHTALFSGGELSKAHVSALRGFVLLVKTCTFVFYTKNNV